MAQQNNPFMVTPGIAFAQPGLSSAIDQFGKMRQIQQLQGLSAAAAAGDEQAYGQLLGLSPDVAKQARGLFVQNKAESLMGDASLSDADRFRQLAALDPNIANAYLKQTQDARKAAEEAAKAEEERLNLPLQTAARAVLTAKPEQLPELAKRLSQDPTLVYQGKPIVTPEMVANPSLLRQEALAIAPRIFSKDEVQLYIPTAGQLLTAETTRQQLAADADKFSKTFGIQLAQLELQRKQGLITQQQFEAGVQAAKEKAREPYKADIPATMLNKATEYQKESTTAQDDAVKYAALLAKMNSPEVKGKLGGGWGGAFVGLWRTATGGQGSVEEVKAQLKQAQVDATKLNLFTGPSTDRDVRLAMSPTFDENANEDVLRSAVSGLIKINQAKAAVNSFQADWILRHGTVGGQADPKRDGFYFEAAPGVEIYVAPGEPYQRVLRRVKAVSLGEKDPNPPRSKPAAGDEEPLPPALQSTAPPSVIPRTQAPIAVGAPLPPAAPRPQGLRPQAQPAQAARPAARPAAPVVTLTPAQQSAVSKYLPK